MAEFQYQGVDRAGKKVTGKLDAPSEGDLRMILRSQGVRPVRIGKVGVLNQDLGKLITGSATRVPMAQLVTFTRQLHVLISSGVPLVQALEVLIEQSGPALKNIVSVIKDKVSGGTYLWEAVGSYPQVFPKIYSALVRAGESSGSLDQMLRRLSRYLEDSDRLRRMLKSAMMYPIVVTLIGIGVIGALLVFVIPKFESLLRSSGQDLPAPTQMVISTSHFLVNNFLFVAVFIGVASYLLVKYVKSAEGKAVIDRLVFYMPIFGPVAQKAAVARFARTMQTLLASGVNLIDAIDICRATIDNSVIEESVARIRADVESGKTFGSVISKLEVFPRMAVQMISVGESTGSLDKMLEKVADFYESEVEVEIAGLTKLIEPLVLVILGGSIGGLMITMYLPIFQLAGGNGP